MELSAGTGTQVRWPRTVTGYHTGKVREFDVVWNVVSLCTAV